MNNEHLNDAMHLLKEAKSAGASTRKEIFREVRDIIDFVEREDER